MAAKTWEADFRYPAICESVAEFNKGHYDDVYTFPGSFCIPIAKKPIVGWTPGKFFVIALVLGFALLGGGVFTLGQAERNENRGKARNPATTAIAACLSITGMCCFFLPVFADKFIMRLLTGARGTELARRPGRLICAEISDTDPTKMKVSIDGDDYALILGEFEQRRLLIEGVAARYMLRADDVTELEPFEFMNYVGAKLTCRINDNVSLSLAIARVSLLLEVTRQVPPLFFLRKLIRNRILRLCTETLRPVNAQRFSFDQPG